MLMGFIFNYKLLHNYRLDWKPIFPIIVYYLLFLLIMPLQTDTPLNFMFSMWRSEAMMNIIFVFVIWNLILFNKDHLKLFNIVLLISIFTATAYGLFLTTTPGFNPYILTMSNINHIAFDADEVAAIGDGRVFGRISSVFTHPMTYALFLGLSAMYLMESLSHSSKAVNIFLLVLVLINVVTCGVRSAILALFVAIGVYIVSRRKFKLLLIICAIGGIAYLFMQQNDDLNNYLSSLTDIYNKKGQVGGSDLEMRLNQLDGALKELSTNPLAGKGYKWHTYYLSKYEGHPTILYFESLIYVILCDGGLLGVFIWITFIFLLIRSIKKLRLQSFIPHCTIIYYLIFSIITGEYGYMKYFIIFYILTLGISYYSSKSKLSYEQ